MKKKMKAVKKSSSSKASSKAQSKKCECCGHAPCTCGKSCSH
ncbi:MAG: hypothetical protein PHS14_09855 [Elusimicrobia bacterium]|nr:hypothetical protein [Elusimicrobiota bacterium]